MSLSLNRFETRYALALYQLAEEKGVLDAVADDIAKVKAIIDDNDDLKTIIDAPGLSRKKQAAIVTSILEKAGINEMVTNFFNVIINNGRITAIAVIIQQFQDDHAIKQGQVNALVTTAIKLDDAMTAKIKAAVAKIAQSDTINMTNIVDETIIGGVIVRIGSKMIDTSIKTKLNNLQMNMKGQG